MGFAAYLARALESKNLSATKFAQMVGMSNTSISNLLKHDDISLKLETLNLFAQALEVPLAHLIRACGFKTGEELEVCDEALLTALNGHWRHRYYVAMMLLLPKSQLEDYVGELSSIDDAFFNEGGNSDALNAATDYLMEPVWKMERIPPLPPFPEPQYPPDWDYMTKEQRGKFLVDYLRRKVFELSSQDYKDRLEEEDSRSRVPRETS